MGILERKTTINEIKNSVDGINSRAEGTEGITNELEYQIITLSRLNNREKVN